MQMTANDIVRLLAIRHKDDVCVEEAPLRNGNKPVYLDFWAMNKSWTRSCCTGYEIKVNRDDFAKDEKFYNYLPVCNMFYFICPKGLIDRNEIPENVGLLYVNNNRISIVKKPIFVEIDRDKLLDLVQGILMNRVNVTKSTYSNMEIDRVAYWESWLKRKKNNDDYGSSLAIKIRDAYRDRMNDLENSNSKLLFENTRLQNVKDALVELGLKEGHNPFHFMRKILRDPNVEMITSIREQIDKVKLALHHMQSDVDFWSRQRSEENEEIETE